MARPRTHIITFTDEQYASLKKQLKSTKTSQTIKGRIRVLLLLDTAHNKKQMTYEAVGKKSATSLSTVRKVVKAYAQEGLDGVLAIKRNPNSDSAKTKVDGRMEANIIKIACGPTPEGHARWTLRLLADRCRVELNEPISHSTIRRALKKTSFDLTGTPTGAYRKKAPENS